MGSSEPKTNQVVVWSPQEGPQTALVTCPVFEVLFGGARGGGKTDAMLGDWAIHSDRWGKGAVGLMLRRERTQLIEAIERSKEIYTPLGATYHEQAKMWTMPGGGRLRFAYLENDTDAEVYQGQGFTRIYVEELTNFPRPEPLMKLMATLRSAVVPAKHWGFRATANPGGPGHAWVKERYIDHDPKGFKLIDQTFINPWTKEKVVKQRVFIPSKITDNKKLDQSEYIANLQMSGSPSTVKAWLEGDWDAVKGSFFPEASKAKHVFDHDIRRDWYHFRSFDWGGSAPFCVQWWQVADGSTYLPRGFLYCYKEWYGCDPQDSTKGLYLSNDEIARGIRSRDVEGIKYQYTFTDTLPFQYRGGPSIEEQFRVNGVMLTRGDTNRQAGHAELRRRLIGTNGIPTIGFHTQVKHTFSQIQSAMPDPYKDDDIDTDQPDHAIDPVRYAVMSRAKVKDGDIRTPIAYRNAETIDEVFKEHDRLIRQRSEWT